MPSIKSLAVPCPRRLRVALLLSTALTLVTCAGSATQGDRWWQGAGGDPAETTLLADRVTTSRLLDAGAPVSDALQGMGPTVRAFNDHVTTLSSHYFEGRAPGTRGIERASEYLQFFYELYGLQRVVPVDGAGEASFAHNFEVRGDLVVHSAEASWRGASRPQHVDEDDFSPLGFSGPESIEDLPIVFVGYSIEDGPDGYNSYAEETDLTGKVAMVLRFEPMNADGSSRWTSANEGRWTRNASLIPKFSSAIDRGAAAVLFVNPPGADDPRAERLMTARDSGFDLELDGPAIMVTPDVADAIVRAGDPQGRTLMDLRRLADAGDAGPVELDATLSAAVDLEQQYIDTHNVVATLPGKGTLANEYVVIGAHYDHLGYGLYGSRDPDPLGKIHPGADDNASGTAGVLVAAQRLSEAYDRLPEGADARSVLFIAFSAEEMGLIGSREWVDAGVISPGAMYCMLNMDMIGRVRDRKIEVSGLGTGEGLGEFVTPIFDASGFDVATSQSGWGPTDHTNFNAAGVPVLSFFSGLHNQYHTPQDTASTVNRAGGAAVSMLVSDVAYALATRPEAMPHIETGPRPGRARTQASVRLGIAPGAYADDETGVLVGQVFEGTTAAIAGMQAGDRIIRWGGEELADIMSMMQRLGDHKPGDKVRVTIVRDGKEIDLDLVMKAREGGGFDELTTPTHGHSHGHSHGHDHSHDHNELN